MALCSSRLQANCEVPPEAIVWMGLYRSTVKKDAFNAYFVAHLQYRPKLRLGNEGRSAKYMQLGDFLGSGEVIRDHSDRLWDYMIRLQGATYPNGDIHSDPFRLPTGLSTEEYRAARLLAMQKKLILGDQVLAS